MMELVNNLVDTARNSFFNTLLSFIETEIVVFGKKTIHLEYDDFLLQPDNVTFAFHNITGKKLTSTDSGLSMTATCSADLKESIEFICDFDLNIEPINKPIKIFIHGSERIVSPKGIINSYNIPANTPFKFSIKAGGKFNLKLFRK